MTDTPMTSRESPPLPRSEMVKGFIGDLARPFALYAMGSGTCVAAVIGAMKCQNGTEASLVIGAAGVVLAGCYGVKEWGNVRTAQAATTTETKT
jgi:hypothetical protein